MIEIEKLIDEFLHCQNEEKLKITVIGDILVDEHYNTNVNRISPEFPVPVIESKNPSPSKSSPGGAALVAWCLTPFNVDVNLFGCCDEDAYRAIKNNGFQIEYETNGKLSPRKRKFHDEDFPIARWDIEDLSNIDSKEWQEARARLFRKINRHIQSNDLDIVILSDYGKGLFYGEFAQDIIQLCNDWDVPTLVDPKNAPIEQWKECTIFKPNQSEAKSFAEKHSGGYVEDLLKVINCESLVMTCGENGVINHLKNQPKRHYKSEKSVLGHPLGYSGAGDCFASVYAVAYAQNFNHYESTLIAHNASQIYVQTKHTKPVTPYDIKKYNYPYQSKIFYDADQLKKILTKTDKIKVIANGCFDLLHEGHLHLLKEAKKHGDILIVAVDSDENIKKLKGENRPIKPLKERMLTLSFLDMIDFVVPFTGTPDKLIEKLQPIQFLVKGNQYSADEVIGADLVESLILVNTIEGKSTTKIIESIKNRK